MDTKKGKITLNKAINMDSFLYEYVNTNNNSKSNIIFSRMSVMNGVESTNYSFVGLFLGWNGQSVKPKPHSKLF